MHPSPIYRIASSIKYPWGSLLITLHPEARGYRTAAYSATSLYWDRKKHISSGKVQPASANIHLLLFPIFGWRLCSVNPPLRAAWKNSQAGETLVQIIRGNPIPSQTRRLIAVCHHDYKVHSMGATIKMCIIPVIMTFRRSASISCTILPISQHLQCLGRTMKYAFITGI